MNNKSSASRQDKEQAISWLSELFPAAFFKRNNAIKPLKIGIFDDIMDFYERLDTPPFTKKMVRQALNYYSTSPAYLRCQQPEAERIDLFGNACDLVTKEQAQYAAERYQQRYVNKTTKATPHVQENS